METFIVKRDGLRDIKFTGEILAATSSNDANASSSYSGSTGRWSELSLYRTKAGKFVCEQVGLTRWQGEHTRYSGAICEDVECVMEFFGQNWLAKQLYDRAGLDTAETIE